ncbi:SDR family NAD(P)-dependent oxidoreductase [Sorangium sp. So ce861]|uniref:SDR family NAD(P)-dependent oxidoreductase n=1 Tax=Sorangium sp. So ce861 TaxID=3133323 RepID=UPI003F61485B
MDDKQVGACDTSAMRGEEPSGAEPAEPVALIGMAGRFPGAPSVEELWKLLCDGAEAIRDVPAERWDAEAYHAPEPAAPGKMLTRAGGFLAEVDRFDAAFFGISPREAAHMDPQQRLALEASWEALEDAGIPAAGLAGSATGVFLGAMWRDYGRLPGARGEAISQHTATGNDLSILAARVSYALGLEGPSVALNTACSSALVAVHLACQSLRAGESSLALVGGVNLMLSPESTVAMTKFGGLSPDGRCFSFDARANGYVRGEGAGVVVLKLLSRARADGDRVRCVILGSAVNNDGRGRTGLSSPSARAQAALLRRAYRSAGVLPAAVQYVEAHGTGTSAGDPVEAEALGEVLGAGRPADRPLLIGSVKTNIGHLEPAAGAAGLIKAALCIERGAVPPSLNFETPNPRIPFEAWRLRVQTELGPWPSPAEPALAGVSAFGFGGTNAHLVLAEPPAPEGEARAQGLRVILVFAGHGSQRPGMGSALLEREPVFRAALAACADALHGLGGPAILPAIAAGAASAALDDVEVGWPALVAVEIGLAALLRSWRVEPAAVVGHSVGEVAAAHVAGALSLEEAMEIALRLARRVARARGAMAHVDLPPAEAAGVIEGRADRLRVAVHASPGATVLSGDVEALGDVLASFSARGVRWRPVRGDVAAHGPALACPAARAELGAALAGLRPRAARVPLYSSATGGAARGESLDAAHWERSIAEPARFAEAVACAAAEPSAVLVEVSAQPILQRDLEAILAHAGRAAVVLPSLRRGEDERRSMLDALAAVREAASGQRAPCPTRVEIVPLSARDPAALAALARAHRAHLTSEAGRRALLADIAYTAAVRRGHLEHRAAAVGGSREEIGAALDALGAAERAPAPAAGRPGIAFVFSGQGTQWAGMGRELSAAEPVFRAAIARCDERWRRLAGWSLEAALEAGEASTRLHDTEVAQPTLFAVQLGVMELLVSWGVEPKLLLGHSLGEVAAACAAGALTLDDALVVVHHRARLLQRATGLGAMASIELAPDEAARAIAGHEGRVAVAAINDPGSVVLSGETAALDEVLRALRGRGVEARRLPVRYAFHSPQVAPLGDALERELEGLAPRRAAYALVSTVTGARASGAELDARYWGRNVREPVQLAAATRAALDLGADVLVEISPHPALAAHLDRAVAAAGAAGRVVTTLRRGRAERRAMLEALAALYAAGVDVRWRALHPRGGRCVSLPSYPWQRTRFWLDAPPAIEPERPARTGEHPLLGGGFTVATQPGAQFWERRLRAGAPRWLADHRVLGEVIVPAAVLAEMALAAAASRAPGGVVLDDLRFERPLALPATGARTVQVAVTPGPGAGASVQVASLPEGGEAWVVHARGEARPADGAPGAEPSPPAPPERAVAEDAAAHYADLAARGLGYGPSFQALVELWRAPGEALARLVAPAAPALEPGRWILQPALIDGGLQLLARLLGAALEEEPGAAAGSPGGAGVAGVTYVPAGAERLRVYEALPREAWVRARLRPAAGGELPRGDLAWLDARGRLLVEARGVRFGQLHGARASDAWLHRVSWAPRPLRAAASPGSPSPDAGTWIIAGDADGLGAALADLLEARGHRCVRAAAGARAARGVHRLDPADPGAHRALLDLALAGGVPLRGIVHLGALDAPALPEAGLDAIEAATRLGLLGALDAARAILRREARDAPRLWLVSRGAQAARDAEPAQPAQALLWGLGQALALEHPELRCTSVDLDPAPRSGEAEALLAELLAPDGEDRVALRADGRRAARLVRAPLAPAPDPQLAPDATYLITGGLGGLGLRLARWMIARGARRVVLAGRRAPSGAAAEVIAELGRAGARVDAAAVDVADRAQLAALLDAIAREGPPLRGVMHAAAVLDDGTALELDAPRIARVLAPKARGAWHLHALTAPLPLDFFVLFSSVASLFGSAGQGSYAAANAFLDALACARQAAGLPGLSVAFGPFSEVGLAAADERRGARLGRRGVGSLSPAEGLSALGRLLGAGAAGTWGVVRLDARRFLESHPGAAASPFWSALRGAGEHALPSPAAGVRDALSGARPEARRALIEAHLAEQIARVVGVDAARLDLTRPILDLGMDSLMSLDLRNGLEASLGLRLPATLLFAHPNVTALSAHLLAELGLGAAAASRAPAAPPAGPRAASPGGGPPALAEEAILRLSESEAEALLLERLGALERRGAP